MSKSNKNYFIQYNSLISLSIPSEELDNKKYTKCLFAEDNLEHSLSFKLCKKPIKEYYDLIGSYFYIRNIDECISNFGLSDNKNKNQNKPLEKEQNITNEISFLSTERIHQNSTFYLQHMTSKKFVSIEISEKNKFILRLLKNLDNAAIFSLTKINEKRNCQDPLTTKEVYNLSVFIKEDDLFLYLEDDINPFTKNNNNYYNILVDKNPKTPFLVTEQSLNIKDSKNIYSGQLINIIFSYIKGNKEEKYMLCVEKKKDNRIDSDVKNSNIKRDNDNKNNNNINYNIIGMPYKNELYEHVLNNSFWVIEEEKFEATNKQPIQLKEHIRIKNLDCGLYLSIRKKGNINSEKNPEIFDKNSFVLENKNFEFILVDEHKLNDNINLEYNFMFINYMMDSICSEIINDGKYILKGVYPTQRSPNIIILDNYYNSISLFLNNNNNITIKNENDFIFQIKKIDIFKGNQVNYIVNIIRMIDKEIKKFQSKNYNITNEVITFFLNYLLNIDYSFRDENYEYNLPIEERQLFLYKFNLVEICTNIIDNYLKLIEVDDTFLTANLINMLNGLLSNIIKFFKFLSFKKEEIKQAIYIIALNKLLKLSETIFYEDFTILISFIYDLIDDSEALQDYLLGGGGLLKQQISSNSKLSKYDITDLFKEKQLLGYIERNHNYLLCYEKLIRLNKVQYKRKEIISDVKNHIDEIKNKNNPSIKNNIMIINKIVTEAIILIKKHSILLERFKKRNNMINEDIIKNKGENLIKSYIKEKTIIKSKEEIIKMRKSRLGTILGNSTALNDSSRNNLSFRPLLDKEKEKSINFNNLINNNENKNKNNYNKNLNNISSFSSLNTFNEMKKSDMLFNSHIYSSIIKKKKVVNAENVEKKETINSDINEPYQIYLNKLGKIYSFIKFFNACDLEKSLFIQDNFLNEINKKGLKTEDYENSLFVFFISKSNLEKSKNWFTDPNFIIFYLFQIYNMIFPNIKTKLQNKIFEKKDISGEDIMIEEMELDDKNDSIDNNYLEIDNELKYKQVLEEDFETLDEFLYILYSIYQFCINQYVKTIQNFSNIISNYYLNIIEIKHLKRFKNYFSEILKLLLSKIIFIKNDILENLYSQSIKNPSLLSKEFDIEFIFPILNELSSKKESKKNYKKQFSKSEIVLIEYLFYMGKKCDQIRYLYEKIIIFKYIKNLINIENLFIKKEDFDLFTKEQLSNILKILNKQKTKILKYYENLNKIKSKYSLISNINSIEGNTNEESINFEENSKNDKYEIFKVELTTEIITKLLREYEIDKFFNNTIYIESSEGSLNTDKIIRKIGKVREHFFQIEKDIYSIRMNFGKDINNDKSFLNLNRHLSQICDDSGKLFNLNKITIERKDKLSQMLSMENNTFYQKIKFHKIFQNMIDAISYYKGEKIENILIYCTYLLKIFNDIKNIVNNFHKTISKYYELYCSLILKSLQIISKYTVEKISDKIQYLFLNICFYGIEGFLIIIKNCKLSFNNVKEFMENIFSELQIIFDKFFNIKYKIIYQILYTYAITRILLFLNNHKINDSYSYDLFFKNIYPIDKMKENIRFCIETINNNSNKENIVSIKNTNVFSLKKESSFIEQDDKTLSLFNPNEEKDPLMTQNIKNQNPIQMDISNININFGETKRSKDKSNIFKDEEEKDIDRDFIRWDDKDELDRLSFYLNFLSVYVIYLNDKNTLLIENVNEQINKENNNEPEKDFSFNNLAGKIKSLLDYRYFNNNNNPEIKEDTNLMLTSQIENSLIKEEKINSEEDFENKIMDYKFHSVLLESILNYRVKLRKKNVEIQIKKVKNKNDNYNEYLKSETPNLELSMKKNNQNNLLKENNNIIFYYYDPEYIDIIVLEKIFSSIELKEDLKNYCTEDYRFEKDNPELLNNLLDIKKNYEMIENYTEEEFNLIHNYFIKNNMTLLIKKILKSFNSNDLIEIEAMENYLFNKMREIYPDTNITMDEDYSEKENSLVEFLKNNEEKILFNLNQIDLHIFFDSLVYIYPKYKQSICIIYYKIGFKLLTERCKSELKNIEDNNTKHDSANIIDLESITKKLILLFSRKTNRELIEDKNVFSTLLNSIGELFSYIKKEDIFIYKNIELIKELFGGLDFIFDRLSKDFGKIVNFMEKPTNLKKTNKYNKKKNRLEDLLRFLIIILEFQKKTEENILTEEINKFIGNVVEKVIKLIYILLKLPNNKNTEIIDILMDFIFNFIKGPEIKNINKLFSLGFKDLVLYVIKDIDYYQLFLNFLSKDNMHEVIDNASEIECRIIKIFIIYYNISYGRYNKEIDNIVEFENIQHWYKNNFKYIKQKLKRLYYMSQKEMEKREYDINKMLLFMKSDDESKSKKSLEGITPNEADSISDFNKTKKNRMIREENEKNEGKENSNNRHFCIIKFDLLLAYYSLYNYHKDLTTKEKETVLIKQKNKSIFFWIINFFIDLFIFVKNFFVFFFYDIFFIFKRMSSKIKNDVDLLQDLTNIDAESQLIDDQEIINFLRVHIRELEVSINNIIYRVFFPMLDKANMIEEYKEEYYKDQEIEFSEFINHIINSYDEINIRAKQYVRIDKIINIPFINLIFKNIYIYGVLLIILGIYINLLIMLSFSTFAEEDCGKLNYPYANNEIRNQCPRFLYKISNDISKRNDSFIILHFKIFGIILIVLQGLIFIDFIVRIFLVEQGILKFKYGKKNITFKIIIKTIYRSLLNFRSLYYILSIFFLVLGLRIHPFFYCITFLEFVNRIQLMQTVLKAMYKPIKNILITLFMFIILEYLFSLLAVSYYTSHFPNETDTKNFLKTFMRMIDQTFKQDGGVGTYLDKTLEKNYEPYIIKSYFNTRFFFDLLFFLLILLLIFQIFLSTIIDYFNDTREKSRKFQEGLETKCTVCFMEREKIEKLYGNDKNAFDKHINYYHNAFNYIYYLMYLESAWYLDDIIEKNVWNIHLNKKLSFLPKKKCLKQLEIKCRKQLKQRKKSKELEE